MYVLSVNPDGNYFKIAVLRQKKERLKICLLQEFRREGLDLSLLKKEIREEADIGNAPLEIGSMLPPEGVLMRDLSLPLKKRRAVMKALPFQLEGVLPPSDKKIVTVPFIKKGKEGSDLLLYNVKEEVMKERLEELNSIGFDPDFVTTTGDALKRFAKTFLAPHKSLTIFHFGWENSYVLTIEGEKVIQNSTLPIGFRELIHAIKVDAEDLDTIDYRMIQGEIEQSSPGSGVFEVVLGVQNHILRVLEFLRRKELSQKMEGIAFTGYAEIMKLIVQKWEDFDVPILQTTPHLEYDRYQITAYALELGIALEQIEKGKGSFGLRVGEFFSKKMEKRRSRTFALYGALLVLWGVVGALSVGGFFLSRSNEIRGRFERIVNLSGEKIGAFPLMQKKILSEEGCRKEALSLVKKLDAKKEEEGVWQTFPKSGPHIEWVLPFALGEGSFSGLQYTVNKQRPTISVEFSEKNREKVEKWTLDLMEKGKGLIEEKKVYENTHGWQVDLFFKRDAFKE